MERQQIRKATLESKTEAEDALVRATVELSKQQALQAASVQAATERLTAQPEPSDGDDMIIQLVSGTRVVRKFRLSDPIQVRVCISWKLHPSLVRWCVVGSVNPA